MESPKEIKLFIKICEDIRDNGPENPHYGLCSNIQTALHKKFCKSGTVLSKLSPIFEKHVKNLNLSWPESSGCPYIPVYIDDHNASLSKRAAASEQYHSHNYPKYEGEYGAARMRLLDYYIEETKKMLKQ